MELALKIATPDFSCYITEAEGEKAEGARWGLEQSAVAELDAGSDFGRKGAGSPLGIGGVERPCGGMTWWAKIGAEADAINRVGTKNCGDAVISGCRGNTAHLPPIRTEAFSRRRRVLSKDLFHALGYLLLHSVENAVKPYHVRLFG